MPETLRAGSSRGMTDQFSYFVCKETEPREGKVILSRHIDKKLQHLVSNLSLTSGPMLFQPKKSSLHKFREHIEFLRFIDSPIKNNLASEKPHIPTHCHCMHKYIVQYYSSLHTLIYLKTLSQIPSQTF